MQKTFSKWSCFYFIFVVVVGAFFDEFDIGDSQGKIQFDIEIKRLERGELIGEWIQYR